MLPVSVITVREHYVIYNGGINDVYDPIRIPSGTHYAGSRCYSSLRSYRMLERKEIRSISGISESIAFNRVSCVVHHIVLVAITRLTEVLSNANGPLCMSSDPFRISHISVYLRRTRAI